MEIRKHPMGPVPKWGLYFYWGRGITRVVFNRPLYPAHVDASDSEFRKLLPVSGTSFPEHLRLMYVGLIKRDPTINPTCRISACVWAWAFIKRG